MKRCLAILFLMLFTSFWASTAGSSELYPRVKIIHTDSNPEFLEWEDAIWVELFHGKRFEKIDFLDPDTNDLLHTLRFDWKKGRPIKISLDGRFEYSFHDHFSRIEMRSLEFIDENSIIAIESQEYIDMVAEESQTTLTEFLDFLEKRSNFFHTQKLFHPEHIDKKLGKNAISFTNEWTSRGVGAALDVVSASLFVVGIVGPVPEPVSYFLSWKFGVISRKKYLLAREVRRRRGLKLKKSHKPYSYRFWSFIEGTTWGKNALKVVDKKVKKLSYSCAQRVKNVKMNFRRK